MSEISSGSESMSKEEIDKLFSSLSPVFRRKLMGRICLSEGSNIEIRRGPLTADDVELADRFLQSSSSEIVDGLLADVRAISGNPDYPQGHKTH